MAVERVPTVKGRQVLDDVTVTIGGKSFDGWESCVVTENIDAITRSFNIQLFDKFAALKKDWPIRPGVGVKVNVGPERVITGYVEEVRSTYGASERIFTVSGRSRSGDLVDCMHLGPSEYTNIKLDDLATELIRPFGMRVFLSVLDPPVIDKFTVKPGETVFEALDRAARVYGYFWNSTRGGHIRLVSVGVARAFTSLEQNVNILSAEAVYEDFQRHSQYVVKGQSPGIDEFFGELSTSAEGTAFDRGVGRYRPFVMLAENGADSLKAQQRAEWECANRLGKATKIKVVVRGWRQENGILWGVNQITHIKSPFLGINRDLLISSVKHEKNGASESGGTTTEMELVDPKAYIQEPEKNTKSSDDIFKSLGAGFTR